MTRPGQRICCGTFLDWTSVIATPFAQRAGLREWVSERRFQREASGVTTDEFGSDACCSMRRSPIEPALSVARSFSAATRSI